MDREMVARELVTIARTLVSAKNQDALVSKLKRELKITWVKPGRQWDENAVLWSGESAEIEVDGEMVPAFDFYGPHQIYEFGAHKALRAWAEKNGLHWEANDPGTFLAYED